MTLQFSSLRLIDGTGGPHLRRQVAAHAVTTGRHQVFRGRVIIWPLELHDYVGRAFNRLDNNPGGSHRPLRAVAGQAAPHFVINAITSCDCHQCTGSRVDDIIVGTRTVINRVATTSRRPPLQTAELGQQSRIVEQFDFAGVQ
jgi:hypothetical protein